MSDVSSIGFMAALLAGGISFLSPCVLPLVPGYVSYIAGQTGANKYTKARRSVVLGLSLCFVLGLSTIFVILGAGATVLGHALLRWRYALNLLGGAILILFGLFMIGMARIAPMEREFRLHLNMPGGGIGTAYILGLAFGFGWTPCIRPILRAILTASATSATLGHGIGLRVILSAGLGVPFLIVAAFTDRPVTSHGANWKKTSSGGRRRHDSDGHRDDDRRAIGAVLLAPQCLSGAGSDRTGPLPQQNKGF